MTKYGYARISSKSQENNSSLEGQKQQLIKNGILEKNILVEVGVGASPNPGLGCGAFYLPIWSNIAKASTPDKWHIT